jgi:hypothetical protein
LKSPFALFGVDGVWHGYPFETPVIPSKAGIQSLDSAFPEVCGVDSRFRGNDRDFERPFLANDTGTPSLVKPDSMLVRPHFMAGFLPGG